MGNIDTSEYLYPSVYIIDEMILPLYLEEMEVRYNMSWPRGDAYQYCYDNLEIIQYLAHSDAIDRDRQLLTMYNNKVAEVPHLSLFKDFFKGGYVRQFHDFDSLHEVLDITLRGDLSWKPSNYDMGLIAKNPCTDWVIFTNEAGARIGIDRETGLLLVYSGDSEITGRITRFNNQPVVFAKEYDDATEPRLGVWDLNIPDY